MAEQDKPSLTNIISATFLVAGACIGAGMLALPVVTAKMGFFPSQLMMLLGFFFMTFTGLAVLEATLWMKEEVHIISLSYSLLGPFGRLLSWLAFLYMGYASLAAYVSEGGLIFSSLLQQFFGLDLGREASIVAFTCLFSTSFYFGNQVVGKVNALLFFALIIAYFSFLLLGFPFVETAYLNRSHWREAPIALPLLLTTFSFPGIVPSLVPMLNRHVPSLRLAIYGGTLIALLVYSLWQVVVLGSVPLEGEDGLLLALENGQSATRSLIAYTGNSYMAILTEFFAFFAIITSFLGIGLALFDFLSDGLKLSKKGLGSLKLTLLLLFPVLFFALSFPKVFIQALESTGGFGDTIISGFIPLAMLWVGRYFHLRQGPYRLKGGKVLIITLFFLSLAIFLIEFASLFLGLSETLGVSG